MVVVAGVLAVVVVVAIDGSVVVVQDACSAHSRHWVVYSRKGAAPTSVRVFAARIGV